VFKNEPRNNRLRDEVLKRFISGVMTDDERAALFGLPAGCRMRENAKIISPENLDIGEYVWIGEGALLDASGGLTIGAHTTIGSGVYLWSHRSFMTNLTLDNRSGSELVTRAPTRVGKGCFIGGPSVIYSGVTIGDKVVVMPMSVVTKDVPSYAMVAGAPAVVKKTIDEKYIEERAAAIRANGR
jgi:acetyltransferase-like isoleucine patch superfamily enzyme